MLHYKSRVQDLYKKGLSSFFWRDVKRTIDQDEETDEDDDEDRTYHPSEALYTIRCELPRSSSQYKNDSVSTQPNSEATDMSNEHPEFHAHSRRLCDRGNLTLSQLYNLFSNHKQGYPLGLQESSKYEMMTASSFESLSTIAYLSQRRPDGETKHDRLKQFVLSPVTLATSHSMDNTQYFTTGSSRSSAQIKFVPKTLSTDTSKNTFTPKQHSRSSSSSAPLNKQADTDTQKSKRGNKLRSFQTILASLFDRSSSSVPQKKKFLVHQVLPEQRKLDCIHQAIPRPSILQPTKPLLGPQIPLHKGKPTLILDLDETLVHTSFSKVENCSFSLHLTIDGTTHKIFVLQRPGVLTFLKTVSQYYEIIIFTASLAQYADMVINVLDPDQLCAGRLFRESCVYWNGQYVKDLSLLGRDLKRTIIIDNCPASYLFQPANAIPIESWFADKEDNQLIQLIPFLIALSQADDIPSMILPKTTHWT